MTLMNILLDAMQNVDMTMYLAKFGAGLGAGLGIGKIGASAMEAIARQPESVGDIRSNMIIAAALVEGVAFFAVVCCLLVIVA